MDATNARVGFRLVRRYLSSAIGVSNRTVDPYTCEKVLIDKNPDAEGESAPGLQAYREKLSQEQAVDPTSQVDTKVRRIAERLVSCVDEVEADLAAEHGLASGNIAANFEWAVSVNQSDQTVALKPKTGRKARSPGRVA